MAKEGGIAEEITGELEAGMRDIQTIKVVLEQTCRSWMKSHHKLVQVVMK